jgi:hypothetical protein
MGLCIEVMGFLLEKEIVHKLVHATANLTDVLSSLKQIAFVFTRNHYHYWFAK